MTAAATPEAKHTFTGCPSRGAAAADPMHEDRSQAGRASWVARWARELLEEMALFPLADEPLNCRCRAFRVLCDSPFHPSCCVTLYDLDGLGEVYCVYGCPGRFMEFRAEVPADHLDALRDELLRLEPGALEDAIEGNGRDGMVLYGEVQDDELAHSWHLWTAVVDGPMPRHHRYCALLLGSIAERTADAALRELVGTLCRLLHQGLESPRPRGTGSETSDTHGEDQA